MRRLSVADPDAGVAVPPPPPFEPPLEPPPPEPPPPEPPPPEAAGVVNERIEPLVVPPEFVPWARK